MAAAQLLIRAGLNDHVVIGDLLAPGGDTWLSAQATVINQLVADAHVAAARPVLAETAQDAGVPYLVDPTTFLLQSHVADEDRFTKLPFGASEALDPADIDVDRLVASVVEFQLDQGATAVIPPYFYASTPTDAWFGLNLECLVRTAEYLRREGTELPIFPIVCAQLQAFSRRHAWDTGVGRFVARAQDIGARSLGLCLSPTGAGRDSYDKVMRLFLTAQRMGAVGLPVIAWRQGVYGLGLVAAGLAGYETGMGTNEQTNISRQQSSRRRRRSGGGGSPAGIYIETLGRSVPRQVGQILLGHIAMRPKVMCDAETCCPTVAATLDKSRHHAVRTRSRMLARVTDQPHRAWRLNQIARDAHAAATPARQANRVLDAEQHRTRVRPDNFEALAEVATHLAHNAGRETA